MERFLMPHRHRPLPIAASALLASTVLVLMLPDPAGAILGCGVNPACIVGKAVGGGISSVAGDAITALANAVLGALGRAIEWASTLWVGVGTPQVANSAGQSTGTVSFLQQNLLAYTTGLAVFSTLIGAARIVYHEHKATQARELIRFLATYAAVSAGAATAASVLIGGSDQMAGWFINQADAASQGSVRRRDRRADNPKEAQMNRRARGEVRVHERLRDGDLTFSIRFRVDGRRTIITLGRASDGWTYRKAERKLEDVLAQVRANVWQPEPAGPTLLYGAMTFHEFASRWWVARREELRPNTRLDYEWRLRKHLLPFFADYKVAEIDVALVDRYRETKILARERVRRAAAEGKPLRDARRQRRVPLSNESINKTLVLLTNILDSAIERGALDTTLRGGSAGG
jgi:hypothetical protein